MLPLGGGLAKPGAGSFEEFENTHFSALRAQAVTGIDGSVNWPVLAIDERDQLTVQPLIGGVYRGLAGVAELLVTTRKTNPRWQLLAQHLLNTLRHESHSLLRMPQQSRVTTKVLQVNLPQPNVSGTPSS